MTKLKKGRNIPGDKGNNQTHKSKTNFKKVHYKKLTKRLRVDKHQDTNMAQLVNPSSVYFFILADDANDFYLSSNLLNII